MLEDLILRAEIEEVWIRDFLRMRRGALIQRAYCDEAIGVGVGKRLEYDGIENGEDRSGGADSKGYDGYGEES